MDIRTDQGSYVGTISLEMSDLLRPFPCNSAQFLAYQNMNGGFNESTKTIPLDRMNVKNPKDLPSILSDVYSLIAQIMSCHVVVDSPDNQLQLSGIVRKDNRDERLILSVEVVGK